MNTVTLQQPPRIVFGAGSREACVADLQARGLAGACSSSPARPPCRWPSRWPRPCAPPAWRSTVYADINREPDVAMFTRGGGRGQGRGARHGGGARRRQRAWTWPSWSAALCDGGQDVRDVFGIGLLRGRGLALVCLPTTAGTGSEVSPNAILLDEAAHLKKGVISPHLLPDAAYVDPLLTVSVPPGVTAATGLDALTHCIEAYANRCAHPIVDVYALEGIRLISGHLLRAVRDGQDLEARERVALGSLYGGLCLAPVNTAAVHALAYPLGGEFHVAHGVANAVLLPHVLRFNLPACPDRYAAMTRAMGVAAAGPDEAAARRGH